MRFASTLLLLPFAACGEHAAQAAIAVYSILAQHLAHDEGGLGALPCIRVVSGCLSCHGEEAAIFGEVRMAVAASYSDDRATGLAPRDLRGWFWIEVP